MESDWPRIRAIQQHRNKNIGGPVTIRPTRLCETNPPAEHLVHDRYRNACGDGVEGSARTLQEILQEEDIMPRGRLQHSHHRPTGKQQNKVKREIKTLEPGSLDSILPQPHPIHNRRSQHHPRHHRIFDKPISKNKHKRNYYY
jgi:hypothetical protein